MAYVSQSDVERAAGGPDRLVELADIDEDNAIDAAVLADAIEEAQGWIDSYLEQRHPVPLDEPVPAQVRRLCAQEVVFILKRGRQAIDDATQQQHEENTEWLRDAARGHRGIGLDQEARQTTPVKAEAGDRSDVTGAVTRTTMEGFS